MSDLPDWTASSGSSYTQVFRSFVGNIPAGGLDVSAFDSVIVLLGNANGTTPLVATYQFVDPTSTFVVDAGLLSANTTTQNPDFPTWTLPVAAGRLKLLSADAGLIPQVIGVTGARPRRALGDLFPSRHFTTTIPASSPSFTVCRFAEGNDHTNNPIPQLGLTSYNGTVWSVTGTSSSVPHALVAFYRQANGAEGGSLMYTNTTGANLSQAIGHPYGYVSWAIETLAASPAVAVSVTLDLTPMTQSG